MKTILAIAVLGASLAVGFNAGAQTPVQKPNADYQSAVVAQAQHAQNQLFILTNVVQGETVSINSKVFEAVTNASALTASTNIPVIIGAPGTPVSGSNVFARLLTLTINSNAATTRVIAECTTPFTNTVVITALDYGTQALTNSETLAGVGNAWASNRMWGGVGYLDHYRKAKVTKRTAIAAEVTSGVIAFAFDFAPSHAMVQVTSSAGVVKLYNGAITIAGNNVYVDNTGSTDFAATDVVTVNATE